VLFVVFIIIICREAWMWWLRWWWGERGRVETGGGVDFSFRQW